MRCYKVSEQILCLGTDFYNHFEMAQCNAIHPVAFSERKRRIPSFYYLDASYLRLKTLCMRIMGKWMYSRGLHTSLACEIFQELLLSVVFSVTIPVYCGWTESPYLRDLHHPPQRRGSNISAKYISFYLMLCLDILGDV